LIEGKERPLKFFAFCVLKVAHHLLPAKA